ncbi:MAG: hypothetical protein C6H99_01605 [Epsilonproteobacteria bacterium]|nr:hypothetical protein [Campylobacterota bacterium]NPA63930.1 divergent polysaccharide deacetylase family protein [Campylobacterota bacterium]
MAKGKKRRRQPPKRATYLLLIFLIFLFAFLCAVLGYFLYQVGYEQGVKERKSQESPVSSSAFVPTRSSSSAISSDQAKEPESQPQKSKSTKKILQASKPKLAIIIDDVAFGWQVKALRSLGMPLNLSFFPPSASHPNTPRYARSFGHYMIHLPMEANGFVREEIDTLRTTSSRQEMERVIRDLRRHFPRARFLNNHTGSRFTADYEAMRRLLPILERYGFVFVDSRTTSKTQVPRVMRELGKRYIARDIFLDNRPDPAYIKTQLKKAIKRAKAKGFAIAIGHPRPATIKALRESKTILKDVELIYIDNLRL